MYCVRCGSQVTGAERFCGVCGAPVDGGVSQSETPPLGVSPTRYPPQNPSHGVVGRLVVRILLMVAGIALGVVAALYFVALIGNAESAVNMYSSYEALAAGVGAAVYVVCGLLPVPFAVVPCIRLLRESLVGNGLSTKALTLPMVFCVILVVMCLTTWICMGIFHTPVGGDASGVLHFTFSTYGDTALTCLFITVGVAMSACVIVFLLDRRTYGLERRA